MLDIKFIRENTELVKQGLAAKNAQVPLEALLQLDKDRRGQLFMLDDLRSKQNAANDEISRLLKEKQNAKEKIDAIVFYNFRRMGCIYPFYAAPNMMHHTRRIKFKIRRTTQTKLTKLFCMISNFSNFKQCFTRNTTSPGTFTAQLISFN